VIVRALESPRLFDLPHSEWPTPQDFFDAVDREFGFTLDVAASAENAKCDRFYTAEQNGLALPWEGVVWCNPPYGREIGAWIAKGFQSAQAGALVVMLLPVRTSPAYFHDYCLKGEIRWIRGRLSFGNGEVCHNAPFDSMLVIFRPPVSIDQATNTTGREQNEQAPQVNAPLAKTENSGDLPTNRGKA